MAAVSEAHSSSASDGGLIALLGQELDEDYFGTGEDGSIVPHSVVGGASDADESQACALESIVPGSQQRLRKRRTSNEINAYESKITVRCTKIGERQYIM